MAAVISLYNKDTGMPLGRITEAQLQNLIDLLVEEHADDRDYFIDQNTLDYMESKGADADLLALIRPHVVGEGVEIEWRRDAGA